MYKFIPLKGWGGPASPAAKEQRQRNRKVSSSKVVQEAVGAALSGPEKKVTGEKRKSVKRVDEGGI